MTTFETPFAANDNALPPLKGLNRAWRIAEAKVALAVADRPTLAPPATHDLATTGSPPNPTFADLLSAERMRIAVAANDNKPKRVREWKGREAETNIEKQVREQRFPRHLLLMALLIQDALEGATRPSMPGQSLLEKFDHYSADLAKPIGAEVTTDAMSLARKYVNAAGPDGWRVLEMALFGNPKMEDLGLRLGYPRKRAASEGRRELIAALEAVNDRLFGFSELALEAAEAAA